MKFYLKLLLIILIFCLIYFYKYFTVSKNPFKNVWTKKEKDEAMDIFQTLLYLFEK